MIAMFKHSRSVAMAEAGKILPGMACGSYIVFSGAAGKGTETRSYQQNRKLAFKRMAESKEFRNWHRLETARRLGEPTIDEIVDREMATVKIEYF